MNSKKLLTTGIIVFVVSILFVASWLTFGQRQQCQSGSPIIGMDDLEESILTKPVIQCSSLGFSNKFRATKREIGRLNSEERSKAEGCAPFYGNKTCNWTYMGDELSRPVFALINLINYMMLPFLACLIIFIFSVIKFFQENKSIKK